MHPVIRALGRVLRLVGISSPEDAKAKQTVADGLPSWRKTSPGPSAPASEKASEKKPG